MLTKTVCLGAVVLALLLSFGCGDGGDDFYSGQKGQAGGGATLDIAGSYLVIPDTFFNMFTIYQSGNSLTATDSSGGSWSGTLSNISTEEKSGAGGTTLFTWRGDVNLTGTNAVGDNLSLKGVVEISISVTQNLVIITAEFQNLSVGLRAQLVLTQVSATPSETTGPGGAGGGGGGQNK